jgi:hypothetical protein
MTAANAISIGILLLALFGLPPLGLVLSGQPLPPHLTLLPIPTEPGEVSRSWPIVGMLALLISGTLAPFLWHYWNRPSHHAPRPSSAVPLPWWGWLAVGGLAVAWTMAWTRFDWFQAWQPHTFPMLWFSYIVMINALCWSRTGQCMLVNQPAWFGQLLVLSAGFWWIFEYLNQFVQNWYYVGMEEHRSGLTIVWMTLAFSTVLPAVLGTYEYVSSFTCLTTSFRNWKALPLVEAPGTGWGLFGLGSLGLLMIGLWPTVLFPLLWIAPLLLLIGIKMLRGAPTVLTPLAKGNWSPVVLPALAALICGGMWEMWNAYSLVHWQYSIPYVHAFTIFEMPVLGYAGYIPFGMECLAVADLFLGYGNRQPTTE